MTHGESPGHWWASHLVSLCLLLETSGIAAAPTAPEPDFLPSEEFQRSLATKAEIGKTPAAGDPATPSEAWASVPAAARSLGRRLTTAWFDFNPPASAEAESPRIARLTGAIPLQQRWMPFILGVPAATQGGPPSPRSLKDREPTSVSESELAFLAQKVATEEIPLLPGFNLISLPEEPAATDPAAVFAALGGQLERVEAYDACDPADPWKVYDPADPAASDLTVVDHRMGLWVAPTVAAALPSDGTLPATTTIELCQGWNVIGFPAGQPRHPHTALSSIAGKWQRLFGYDAFDSQDPWEIFDPAVPAWANDLELMQPGRGYWLLVSEAATLEIRNQGAPPTVSLTTPADLAVVTQPTDIVGTVESDLLDSWTLTYSAIGDGEAIPIASGNIPVSSTSLGTFDPTLLLNGLYELTLTATDLQGQQVSESIAMAVEGQMKIGHFTLSFVDLAIPLSGLDIEIIRTYDSRDKRQGDFGVGWSLDIRQGSYRNNRPPGEGWQLHNGFLPCDTVLETESHLTVVRLSDQEVYRFALRLADGVPTQGGCFADARFDFVDGPLPGTTLEIQGQSQVFYENGSDRVVDVDTLKLFEPEDVRLTTRDGRIFELDLTEGVTLVEDLNGNRLSITSAGITHSSGKGIAFDRDVEGRMVGITDPLDRSLSYSYDTAGDLVSFTDRVSAVTRFTYDADHRLIDIEDPRGVKPLRNEYDAEGRLVRHIDAFGKVIELGHDPENRREVVTNRLGQSRVLEYDARGNVIRETDEAGHVTVRTYDGRDNLLSERDSLGRTTTFTYSADGDLVSQKDPLGNETVFTYNTRGQLLSVTDPRGGVTASIYDISGNLTSTTDALGSVTSFTYDAAGNLLTTTDAEGGISRFEYDAFGNQTNEVDALGNKTVSTYDAAGNRLSETRTRTLPGGATESLLTTFAYDAFDRVATTTAADGSTTSVAYNLLGNVSSRTDELGRVTLMSYDLMGRLVQTKHPDGTSESRGYDGEGRVLTQTDRDGAITSFSYDVLGRLTTTTFADGAAISNSYDAAGQLVAAIDARGNTSRSTYDPAGRRTSIVDSVGNGAVFTYDANGNQTAVDLNGHATTFTWDAVNRLIKATHPDGTTIRLAYDGLGRRVAETDQAGTTNTFGYDALGRMIRVEDSLSQITRYTYDEVGNRLTQTDANGHTTSFEYDRLGRQTARVFPDGSRESMVYNADGTLAKHTDFNGATRKFQYDINQRLLSRIYADDTGATFTYSATGRRTTATDTRGTTTYSYDSRGRLIEKTDPNGYKLTYGYDLHGNRIELTATVGAETYTSTYTYDTQNRLTTVTDSQGGISTIDYDANGNRTKLTHPNGMVTEYSYDALNRLIDLSTTTSSGEVVASFAYTLGAAGNRTRVEEHNGVSRHYIYDDLYRLSQERVTDREDELMYQRDFTYDPVGNRLQETVDQGGSVTTLLSSYDSRDRLLAAGGTSFDWDSNGNLRSQGTRNYSWDVENRLTAVTLEDGTLVETEYDTDGNRVRSAITAPTGETTVVDYLVDTTGFLSHVVVEVADEETQTIYTRADNQLIGLHQPGLEQSRYYHADGLGSVRMLSDERGEIVDRYSYTAFGELIEHIGLDLQPYLFAGEAFEASAGIAYHRARWMDASTGRFLAADPFPGDILLPKSLVKYAYAGIDPVNATDPSGLFTIGDFNAILAAFRSLPTLMFEVVRGVRPAWKHRRNRWRFSDQQDFREFIKNSYRNYLGQLIDCADLAITLLVDFAASRGLPVHLESNSGPFDSRRQVFRNNSVLFREAAKNRINAHMLFDLNTFEKGKMEFDVLSAEAGDLMMLKRPNSTTGHTRIFLSYQGSDNTVQWVEGTQTQHGIAFGWTHGPVVERFDSLFAAKRTPSLRWWSETVFR